MDQETTNKEIGRLENSDIPRVVKDKIREFVDDILLSGLSLNRQYFYAIRLRQIASLIPDKFLNPSTADIKRVMSTLMSGKIGRRIKGKNHSSVYSDW
ncbi:TVG0680586 [Thermoplasma volcanium GSS1]|uniref:TVG0680586 protein n=1 Tax=Thermoplasma volcanium (strain ATCC 51530 / DSM 4299 / JCM 9571 / NBRC 15438 / GSS1) TaxID=273116 RepID=Q97AX9_THEVO|nr:hypothetical protein [Thermoplasma volcanium]BAB59822.1 TVG0680586 [Thermoplasma volcanium GSS1]